MASRQGRQGHGQLSLGTWSTFYRYLYLSFKQNTGEHFRATWPSCFALEAQNNENTFFDTSNMFLKDDFQNKLTSKF